jgi:hypothetical protein
MRAPCRTCAGPIWRHNVTGHCKRCAPTARPCEVPDCLGRVSSSSRSGVCGRHAPGEAAKFRRQFLEVRRCAS